MHPHLHIAPTNEALIEALAAWLVRRIEADTAEGRTHRLALAGGSTPRPLYQRLARPDLRAQIDWSQVEIFFGDERAVPPTDPASNYRMARSALIDHVPIELTHVHRVHGELEPRRAAREYAATLGAEPLDVALLGMGGDGHTASLFPGGDELDNTHERVLVTRSPVSPAIRISLGFAALNTSRDVVLLVSGVGKAERLAEVYDQLTGDAPATLPAAMLQPEAGHLRWFLDADAASQLPQDALQGAQND